MCTEWEVLTKTIPFILKIRKEFLKYYKKGGAPHYFAPQIYISKKRDKYFFEMAFDNDIPFLQYKVERWVRRTGYELCSDYYPDKESCVENITSDENRPVGFAGTTALLSNISRVNSSDLHDDTNSNKGEGYNNWFNTPSYTSNNNSMYIGCAAGYNSNYINQYGLLPSQTFSFTFFTSLRNVCSLYMSKYTMELLVKQRDMWEVLTLEKYIRVPILEDLDANEIYKQEGGVYNECK